MAGIDQRQRQRLSQTGMRKTEVIVTLKQQKLAMQTRITFGQCDHPPSDRRDMLTKRQIQPLDKSRIDLPASVCQALLDLGWVTKDHPLDQGN